MQFLGTVRSKKIVVFCDNSYDYSQKQTIVNN